MKVLLITDISFYGESKKKGSVLGFDDNCPACVKEGLKLIKEGKAVEYAERHSKKEDNSKEMDGRRA